MLKGCFRFLVSLLSILAITFSVLFLTMKSGLINSNLFKTELNRLEVYDVIHNELEKQQKGDGINEYYQFIAKNIEIKPLIKTTIENNLDNVEKWLGNIGGDLYIYIPIDEFKAGFTNEELKKLMLESIEQQISAKDTCTPEENKKFDFMYDVNSIEDLGDISQLDLPDCVPTDKETFLNLANQIIGKEIDKNISGTTIIDAAFKTYGLENVTQNTKATDLFRDQETVESVNRIKQVNDNVTIGAYVLFVAGILLALINGYMSKKTLSGFISGTLYPILASGIILTIVGITFKFIPELFVRNIPIQEILDDSSVKFTFDTTMMAANIKASIVSIVNSTFNMTFIVGVVMTTVSLVIIILTRFIKSDGSERPVEGLTTSKQEAKTHVRGETKAIN